VLLALALGACREAREEAAYRVPNTDAAIVIERKPAHPVLAEYHRWARLDVSGKPATQVELFIDSGGYSRANLYRLSGTAMLLRDADASYLIDVAARIVTRDTQRRKAGSFLGSFDIDASKTWRYISAEERAELPTEFTGG
jgi:hypothetical protein